jgi:hypothetical protein
MGTTRILSGRATQKDVNHAVGQFDKALKKLPCNNAIASDIPPDIIIDIIVENK